MVFGPVVGVLSDSEVAYLLPRAGSFNAADASLDSVLLFHQMESTFPHHTAFQDVPFHSNFLVIRHSHVLKDRQTCIIRIAICIAIIINNIFKHLYFISTCS